MCSNEHSLASGPAPEYQHKPGGVSGDRSDIQDLAMIYCCQVIIEPGRWHRDSSAYHITGARTRASSPINHLTSPQLQVSAEKAKSVPALEKHSLGPELLRQINGRIVFTRGLSQDIILEQRDNQQHLMSNFSS